MVKFDVNQYAKRWLCKQKFDELYPELHPSLYVIPKMYIQFQNIVLVKIMVMRLHLILEPAQVKNQIFTILNYHNIGKLMKKVL